MSKSEIPEALQTLVDTAISLLSPRVAAAWKHDFDRNRVVFKGYGFEFRVRDKGGFFTITYEHMPGEFTTKHYKYEAAIRLLLRLFHRPPDACKPGDS